MATITVTSNANQGSGSLREAISIAKDGDTIKFAKNLAQKTITLTTGQLILGKSITLDGQNVPGLTISGNRSSRVFQIEKNIDITIKDLRIAEGKVNSEGGGIRARQGSSLTLVNTQIENNVSELGGGLRLGHLAKATIIDSEFKGNNGTLTANKAGFSAGAISTDSRAELIIQGTKFIENQGFNGG
ncbi:MAG: hemolysin, partial [Cyanobacteria bacterium J06633_23]